MRVSKQVMAENNSRIINEAARLFREKGVESTSVADVMGAAGLTNGGFYRHFQSKDELVNAAIRKAFKESTDSLENNKEQRDTKRTVTNFVQHYLSEQHVNEPGKGCPIAALGAATDRSSNILKSVLAEGTEQVISLLAQGIEGTADEKQEKATTLLAVLVGTLVLARSADTKTKMREILSFGAKQAKFCLDS